MNRIGRWLREILLALCGVAALLYLLAAIVMNVG